MLLAHFALAWGLRTFGKSWGTGFGAGGATSPYAGQQWPLMNYAYALGIGYAMAKLLSARKGGHFALVFWQTICREVLRRFVWTEGVSRIPGAQAYLGNVVQGSNPGLVTPGAIHRDSYGNTWQLREDGQWIAMQGLVEERPLDGEQLVMERPLDGLTTGRSIDRADGGYGRRYLESMAGMAPQTAIAAAYSGRPADPYSSSYT